MRYRKEIGHISNENYEDLVKQSKNEILIREKDNWRLISNSISMGTDGLYYFSYCFEKWEE